MMSVIGERPALWLTARSLLGGGAYADEHMRAGTRRCCGPATATRTCAMFDWAAAVRDEWFIEDGIHYTSDGYAARAHRIAMALAEAFPAGGSIAGLRRRLVAALRRCRRAHGDRLGPPSRARQRRRSAAPRGISRTSVLGELAGADRLMLLGDVLELRDRPLGEVLDGAAPALAALGRGGRGTRGDRVPGNHDHHLIEPGSSGERSRAPAAGARAASGRRRGWRSRRSPAAAAAPTCASPTRDLWLRDDVYATHGHYLDRHLTVPTIERLGVGAGRAGARGAG